ncbi:MAG: ParB/RepB/Spo0J family partition protein [Clostridia bacterium]|jgi:ParB family chromosome partitioning protein|nr:ParB/RepB/Spo0J family partition protein [Clostridia bacterium]
MAKKGLGRGLSALLSDNVPELPEVEAGTDGRLIQLHISDIEPNRKQPRKHFDENALMELAESIGMHGLLEPIAVRKKENGYYEIIAGERRWRASRMAGLNTIPAIVKEIGDEEAALLALIENLQREDLNPVEEALGYRDLIQRYELTQEEAAKKVGKSRANVANLMRILNHPASVLALVENGSLTYGHARALLPLAEKLGEKELLAVAEKISEEDLSVRQTEALAKKMLTEPTDKPVTADPVKSQYLKVLERSVSASAGRKAAIKAEKDGSGKLVLSFASTEDLETLLTALCGKHFLEELSETL